MKKEWSRRGSISRARDRLGLSPCAGFCRRLNSDVYTMKPDMSLNCRRTAGFACHIPDFILPGNPGDKDRSLAFARRPYRTWPAAITGQLKLFGGVIPLSHCCDLDRSVPSAYGRHRHSGAPSHRMILAAGTTTGRLLIHSGHIERAPVRSVRQGDCDHVSFRLRLRCSLFVQMPKFSVDGYALHARQAGAKAYMVAGT